MFQSIDPNRHANFNNNNNNQQQPQNIPVVNTNSAINRQHMANYHNGSNNMTTNVNNQQQPQQQNYTNFNNNSSPLGSQNLSQQQGGGNQSRVGNNNNNNNNNATSSSQNMMMANPSSSASFNPNLPLGLPALRRAFSKLARGGQCDVTPEHLATALRKCEPALRPALESLWARSRHDSRYFISHLQSTTEIALIQGASRTSLGFETTLYSIVKEICPILLSQIRAALQREEELKKNLVAMMSMKTTTAAAATEDKNNAVSCDGEGQNQEQDDEEQEMSLPMPGPSSNSNMSQQQQRHVDPSIINPIFSAPTTTTTTRQNIDYLHRQVTEFFVAVCDYLCDTIALSGATNTQLLSSAIHDTLPSHLWNHYARRRGASESTSMSASTASQAGSPSSNGSSPIDHFSVGGGGGSALNSQTRLPRRGNSSSGNNNALPVGDDDSSAGVVAGNTTVTAAGATNGGTPFSGSHYSVSSNGATTSTSAGVIMGGGSGNITHQNNNNNSNNNIHLHSHHHPHAHSHQHAVIEFNIHHFRSLMRSGLSSSNEKRVEECRILLGEVLQIIVTDVEVPMWTNKCPFNGGVASIIHEMIACEHKQLNFDYFTGFSDGERAMSTSAGVGNATATTPPPPTNSANANPTQNNSKDDNAGTVSSTTPPSSSVGTSNNNNNPNNNATATASHSRHPALNPKMRIVLVDWLHAICSRLRMSDHTFHMNIALLDTALCLQQNITTHQLQLLGIAAMYLASKYHEMFPPQITQFVYMSANAYSVDEILGAERNLFTLLDCRFVFPSALEAADVILIEQDPPATPEQRVIVQFLLHVHLHHTVYGGGGQSILAARAAVFISRVLCGITFASSRQHLNNTSSSSVNGNGQVGNNIQNGRNPIVSISEVPPQTASASPVNPAANNNNNNNNNHSHANNSNAANCSNENSNQHADSNNASAAAANGQNNNNVNTSIISTTSSSSFLLAGRRRTAFNRKNGMNMKNENNDNKRRSSCSRHRRGRGDEENEDVYDDGQDENVEEENQDGRENHNGDNNNNENLNIDEDNANKEQQREEEEDESSFLPSQLLQRNKNNNTGGSQNNNNFNNFFSASADDLPFLVLRNCHLSEREYWYIDKMLNQLQELKNPETKAQDLVTRYGHKKYFFVANRDFDKEKILSVARENIFVGRLFSTSFEIQSDVVRENITNRGTLM